MSRYIPITLVLILLLGGCAQQKPVVVSKQYASEQARRAETERAMKQLLEADLAINYESESRLFLYPAREAAKRLEVRLSELEHAVTQCTTNRTMVVVTMGPPMRMLPQEQFDAKVQEIEKILTGTGFRRVIFHLASAFGSPIYRE